MDDYNLLQAVMRSLGAGWRAVRLYPQGSPMTEQATETVCNAAEDYLQLEPSLKLDVMRGGFMLRGLDDILSPAGVPDFAEALGSHGIGELHFVAPPDAQEMLALYQAAGLQPQKLADRGGMQAALSEAGVTSIRVVSLVLSKVETPPEIPEEEADRFLAELAADAGRLAVWLRSLLASDDEGLVEGIRVLASAAGDVESFGRTMAAAFLQLESAETDRLLEASIALEGIRDVAVAMLANLSAVEITAALRGGRYGNNLMALSFALAHLPVGARADELVAEAVQALRSADAGEDGVELLQRMVASRRARASEMPSAESSARIDTILGATRLAEEHMAAAREQARSRGRLDAGGVATVLHLLDLADDFTAYSSVLDALGRSAPHLIEVGDPDLAMTVVHRIGRLSASTEKAWPGLGAEFSKAMDEACGPRSMTGLLGLAGREKAIEHAKELVALGGDRSAQGLANAALDFEAEDSMAFAEAVLGKRLPGLLAGQSSRAEARHAAQLAELLARDGGPACMQGLSDLVSRPEDQVRSKTARGIAAAGGRAMALYAPKLLGDDSRTVAMVTVHALAAQPGDEWVALLAARLAELGDEADVPLAREIIGSLAASDSPVARRALENAAERGGFLRRGRHSDIRRMARDALETRDVRGDA